jgi:hypothetical protein
MGVCSNKIRCKFAFLTSTDTVDPGRRTLLKNTNLKQKGKKSDHYEQKLLNIGSSLKKSGIPSHFASDTSQKNRYFYGQDNTFWSTKKSISRKLDLAIYDLTYYQPYNCFILATKFGLLRTKGKKIIQIHSWTLRSTGIGRRRLQASPEGLYVLNSDNNSILFFKHKKFGKEPDTIFEGADIKTFVYYRSEGDDWDSQKRLIVLSNSGLEEVFILRDTIQIGNFSDQQPENWQRDDVVKLEYSAKKDLLLVGVNCRKETIFPRVMFYQNRKYLGSIEVKELPYNLLDVKLMEVADKIEVAYLLRSVEDGSLSVKVMLQTGQKELLKEMDEESYELGCSGARRLEFYDERMDLACACEGCHIHVFRRKAIETMAF